MPPTTTHSETSTQPKTLRKKLWQRFWLLFLVTSLAYAWYSFYAPSNSIAWAENFANAQQRAIEADKPMILYFTGKWCSPCRIMKRQVWADAEVTARVNDQFIPVAIHMDDSESADIVTRYKVLGAPVTMITDSQGNVLQWRDGGLSKPEFLELISNAQAHQADE